MDYSARIRKVAIVSEFACHLHTIKFQNFKTAVVLLESAFIVRRLRMKSENVKIITICERQSGYFTFGWN